MFDRFDIYLVFATAVVMLFIGAFFVLLLKRQPSVETLSGLASIFNSKGGIIMFLWFAWWMTLLITLGFGMWVIIRGVDPQHGVVITLLGMLSAQAFGNVNGALFKTMTGEEPSGRKPDSGAGTVTITSPIASITPGSVSVASPDAKPETTKEGEASPQP